MPEKRLCLYNNSCEVNDIVQPLLNEIPTVVVALRLWDVALNCASSWTPEARLLIACNRECAAFLFHVVLWPLLHVLHAAVPVIHFRKCRYHDLLHPFYHNYRQPKLRHFTLHLRHLPYSFLAEKNFLTQLHVMNRFDSFHGLLRLRIN